MNPILLAALINNIAIPELTRWLQSLHASQTPITDEIILKKLLDDTTFGARLFDDWLAAHPPTP